MNWGIHVSLSLEIYLIIRIIVLTSRTWSWEYSMFCSRAWSLMSLGLKNTEQNTYLSSTERSVSWVNIAREPWASISFFKGESDDHDEILSGDIAKSARCVVNKFGEIFRELEHSHNVRKGVLKRLDSWVCQWIPPKRFEYVNHVVYSHDWKSLVWVRWILWSWRVQFAGRR